MSIAVNPPNSTYSYISTKVRRLTALSSEYSLSTSDLDTYINNSYQFDFPYAIKIDQTRSVYRFFTIPNVDRYPVDVNNNMGFRSPVYIEGILGNLFKDRQQFFNLYPRFPTQMQQGVQTLSGIITLIGNFSGNVIIFSTNSLTSNSLITIDNVVGSVELNGNTYSVIDATPTAFVINVLFSTISAYISGGTWISASPSFSFNLFGNAVNPFPQPNFGILSTSVVIGGIDFNGNPIRIIDDGGAVVNSGGIGNNTTIGQLLFVNTNQVGNPVYATSNPPIVPVNPSTSTLNQQNNAIPPLSPLPVPSPASPLTPQYVGNVNYITSQFEFNLPVTPMPGTNLNIWCNQYVTARPFSVLFFNNELTVRPVPDNVYQIEIETFLTPVQFLKTTDNPALNQWAMYIAYLAAMEILRDRQDMEGVENLKEGMMRQEGLVLERQSIEEIFQPNFTLFNSTTYGNGLGSGSFYGGVF